MNNVVTTPHASFRWEDSRNKLVITTAVQQLELDASQALELADLLYHRKAELFKAYFDLPNPTSQQVSPETR